MSMYLAALVWMGRISAPKPLPRFIGVTGQHATANTAVAGKQGGVG